MFKNYCLILLFAHILGDYYFQTSKLAEEKDQSSLGILKHSCLYALAALITIAPIFSTPFLYAGAALVATHFIIDYIKMVFLRNCKKDPDKRCIYLLDQFLHIACIMIISYCLTSASTITSIISPVKTVFITTGIPAFTVAKWILLALLIWKPTNVTIKKLLSIYKPFEKEETDLCTNTSNHTDDKKTGGFIGVLERLIILVFLSISQYSAIGLVLTAKSIARYDKISKDKPFAEYYLLGTLLSTILVILIYFIII